MWIQVPDAGPMMGGQCNTTDPSTIFMAKAVLKEHKANRKKAKEDEEKKKAKDKPKTFTILETWGILMLGSIPLTLAQIHLLQYTQEVLSNAFHVTPH